MDSEYQHCLGWFHLQEHCCCTARPVPFERPASQSNQRCKSLRWRGFRGHSRSLARLESIGSHLPAVPCAFVSNADTEYHKCGFEECQTRYHTSCRPSKT